MLSEFDSMRIGSVSIGSSTAAPVAVRLSRSAALAGRPARHHGDGDRAAYHFFSFFRRLLVQLGPCLVSSSTSSTKILTNN